MFETVTPESVGLHSAQLKKVHHLMDLAGLNPHAVLCMRGERIFEEAYYAPFHRDFCHRMYSETKSFVGIAVGLLIEEGKLTLDSLPYEYLKDRAPAEVDERVKRQTVRDFLTMSTAKPDGYFFTDPDPDRVHIYYSNKPNRDPDTLFEYDSPGTQMLATLVERLAGMPLLDYLRRRIFDYTGGFETAEILKVVTGESWADSALLCRPRDMLIFARFLMNGGVWNGKRLMNEAYIKEAVSPLVDNCEGGSEDNYACLGYGYQIWADRRTGGFFFNGMGDQFTFAFPEKDLIFTINSDNQGIPGSRQVIYNAMVSEILEPMADAPLPEDPAAYEDLLAYERGLKLRACTGDASAPVAAGVCGTEYLADGENPMGITRFSLHFGEENGELHYTNAQGDKVLKFGLCKNEFTKFPELGYNNDIAAVKTTDGFMFDCACAGAWRDRRSFMIRVRVIDRYFGNLTMQFGFSGDRATLRCFATAEYFFYEYRGQGSFRAQR